MTEPLSPVAVEQKLRQLVSQLTKAQQELAAARDVELDAEIALRRARLVAAESENCPKVTRGGPTVADREAFIDAETFAEWSEHRKAVVLRDVAQDSLRTVRDIASVVQSVAQLVRQAYGMAGTAA